MKDVDVDKLSESLGLIAKTLEELERTILFGWPHEEFPTEKEALAIESTYHELSLHHSTMDIPERERWRLAGQIIARIDRDAKEAE